MVSVRLNTCEIGVLAYLIPFSDVKSVLRTPPSDVVDALVEISDVRISLLELEWCAVFIDGEDDIIHGTSCIDKAAAE